MMREVSIHSFSQVQHLVSTACEYKESVGVHDARESIADAKSILGMMSLDFTRPVRIVADNESVLADCVNAIY